MPTSSIILDSSPLGRLTHPKQIVEIAAWQGSLEAAGHVVYLSAITDYEVRRGQLAANMTRAVVNLDFFRLILPFVPVENQDLLDAAQLWADLRRRGLSTASPKELDGDAILAAQANRLNAVVATENLRHLELMCQAKDWREIKP